MRSAVAASLGLLIVAVAVASSAPAGGDALPPELQDLDPIDPADEAPEPEPLSLLDQFGGSILDPIMQTIAPPLDNDQADRNVQAFLMMIRRAEGTAGPNGYRTLFGGRLFDGWADHPRKAVQFTDGAGRRLWTTAAGAYQFMAISPIPTGGRTRVDTWDRVKARLGLRDFGPASQDLAAIELIREAGALLDVRAGRLASAVRRCASVWASLPGAGYDQPERTLAQLDTYYRSAGGALA